MDFNTIECSENALFNKNSNAFERRFSLPLFSSVRPSHRLIGLFNIKRIVSLTFERFKKMSNFNDDRCKSDYEDLDFNIESPVENDSKQHRLSSFRSQPNFYLSDSAIYVNTPKKIVPQIEKAQRKRRDISGSIPYLFRQNRELSQFPEKAVEQKSDSLYNCLIRKENIWLISFIFFFIIYIALGSYFFLLIEQPIEEELRRNFTQLKETILSKYSFKTTDESNELKELENFFLSAHYLGISVEETELNKTHWTFGQSLFFSTTLVTTVGYGHITPRSKLGKVFCMLFSGIGIPLTITLTTAIVGRLLTPSNYLLKILVEKFNYTNKYFIIRLVHLFIIASLVLICFFGIPVVFFYFNEPDWTILDAFYFCFISLTTIGLGDFIPGTYDGCALNIYYMILISVFLISGLTAMILLMTVFYEIPQLNIGVLFLNKDARDKYKEQSRRTSSETVKE